MSTAPMELPVAVRDRLKGGSRARQIVLTVHQEALRRGYGPTVGEARAAFADAGHAVPRSFASEIHSLHKRGLLEARGRPGELRFVVVGGRYDVQAPPVTDADLVLKALRAVVKAKGFMASTREVLEAIRKKGWKLQSDSVNAVRSLLLGLARDRVRGSEDWTGPLVLQSVVEGVEGINRSFWAPADSTHLAPPDPPVTSRREALVVLVSRCIDQVGRLPSRGHLTTYLKTLPPQDRLRSFFPGKRPSLMGVVKLSDIAKGRGRLRTFQSPLLAHGGPPVRFWIGEANEDPPPLETAAAVLDDFVYAYRLGDEADHLRRVRRAVKSGEQETLEPLLAAREAVFDHVVADLHRHLPTALDAAVTAAEEADLRYYRMLGEANGHAWSRTRQRIARRRARRRNFVAGVMRKAGPRAFGGARLDLVGHAHTITLRELEEYSAGHVELGKKGIGPLLGSVRRFDNAEEEAADRIRNRSGERPALSVVDRAEALVALGYRWAGPWTRQMLGRSYRLLGEIARSEEALAEVIQRSSPEEVSASLRRQILVAGGLLGLKDAVMTAEAVALSAGYSRESIHDLRAAVLVTALVDPARIPQALDRLREWDQERRFADLHRKMTARASRGRWLAVAD